MGLSSFFSRRGTGKIDSAGARSSPADAADSVQQARNRARHRLIGATVLVVLGIVVFPLLFETEPRRVSSDIPIQIVRRDAPAQRPNLPAAAVAEAPAAKSAGETDLPAKSPAPVSEPVGGRAPDVITETAADAGREIPPPPRNPERAAPPEPAPARVTPAPPKPAVQAEARPAAKPAPAPPPAKPTPASPGVAPSATTNAAAPAPPPEASRAPAPPSDAARAQLLLEGKEVKAEGEEAPRYVVQVGAFADAAAARETRLRVERLGLKTYTQVAQTAAGGRTRVRVGPVTSREEADRMQARLKAAGLPAVVLTL